MSKNRLIKRTESEKELKAREEDDEIPPLHPEQKQHANKALAPLGEEPFLEELDVLGFTEEGPGTPDDGDQPITEERTED